MSDPLIRDTQGKLYEAKGQKWKKYISLVSAEARSHTSPFWLVSMASMHRLNESKEEWSGVQCRRAWSAAVRARVGPRRFSAKQQLREHPDGALQPAAGAGAGVPLQGPRRSGEDAHNLHREDE